MGHCWAGEIWWSSRWILYSGNKNVINVNTTNINKTNDADEFPPTELPPSPSPPPPEAIVVESESTVVCCALETSEPVEPQEEIEEEVEEKEEEKKDQDEDDEEPLAKRKCVAKSE